MELNNSNILNVNRLLFPIFFVGHCPLNGKTWSSVNLLLVGLSCHKSSHQTIKTFCCSTLADAGENRGEQRTAAADAQNDPGDHVVNVHEVTG